jgi:hypothetical protein
MPVYTFSYVDSLQGATVSVLNAAGTEVTTGTLGSPDATGMCVLSKTLDEGQYYGLATSSGAVNPFGGVTHASDFPARIISPGVLDIPASIAAGGGTTTTGSQFFFEANSPLNLPTGFNTAVTWDTAYGSETGYADYAGTVPTTQINLPVGIYQVDYEIDINPPAADRLMGARMYVKDGDTTKDSVGCGTTFIPTTVGSGELTASGLLVIADPSFTVELYAQPRPADASESSPPDVVTSYCYAIFRKIG